MLTRCGDRVEAEPVEVRQRVSLAERDIRNFSLPDRFTLAVAPFRILQHLITSEEQLRSLAAVRRHLEPGGRFVFDVFNPSFALLVKDRTCETGETPELELPDGRFMWRTYRIPRVRFVDQVNEVELIYYVRKGVSTERIVQAFEMRWYQKAELEHLLARAGFVVEAMYGGFDRRPLTDAAPEIVVVARTLAR
jgi:SAM-dependent methyltransferase